MKEKYLKSLIVIVVIIIGGLFIYQNVNKENKPLPEVKLKEIVNKDKSFAIMIQNETGYEEYDSNTWPGEEYVYKEAKCSDNNGVLVEDVIVFADGKATLTTTQTVYCTLYFDLKQDPIEYLRKNDSNGNLSEDIQGGMYRYQGTDNVPNYICFGTTNKEECINEETGIDKYMYRIIGITEDGEIYLIKETFLKEGEINAFVWNNVESESNGNNLLFKRINGISNGSIPSDGENENADTDIFVDNEYYDYLKSGDGVNGGNVKSNWYDLIKDNNWPINFINMSEGLYNDMLYNGKELYSAMPLDNTVPAKINLISFYDYDFAYYDGSDDNTRGNPEDSENLFNSWIYFQKDNLNTDLDSEWLSFGDAMVLTDIYYLMANYISNDYGLSMTMVKDRMEFAFNAVRPAFYLKDSVKITDGDGTKTNPYIIEF